MTLCFLVRLGLSARLSKAVVQYRDEQGVFTERDHLLKVKGIGQKTFVQAAGFLRIHGGPNALDSTAIHPESYPAVASLRKVHGDKLTSLHQASTERIQAAAKEGGLGVETLKDILEQLNDVQDPRQKLPQPVVKSVGENANARRPGSRGIDAQQAGLSVADLKPGMVLCGTVRNVVAFGAFIDIGVQHDGLLHVSKYPQAKRQTAGWPQVNDPLDVAILTIEHVGHRVKISLSMQ